MSRTYHTYTVETTDVLKKQMLSWANHFNICCFMDNHNYVSPYHSYECLVGVGVVKEFSPGNEFFSSLNEFAANKNDWMFGHFNYELKNRVEKDLISDHTDHVGFPEYTLFIPEVVLLLKGDALTIGSIKENSEDIYRQIIKTHTYEPALPAGLAFQPSFTKEDYISTVDKIKQHIQVGDCYVINFCIDFATRAAIEPVSAFNRLAELSPNPFSAYYRLHDKYLLCASPERFIRRDGSKIISQPIKGTAARSIDGRIDEQNKQQLFDSPKERSENVMVVDLVRNDLSKVAAEASVTVEELYGIYTFPTVHQMISTVTGSLRGEVGFGDILHATFPMGSMTGAPKKRVMELVEQYERSQRGIYSGTVGYISPQGDFDFNVVIRSLMYNQATDHLSFHVGSAITTYCNPEQEYEECLLKGEAMRKVFNQ